MTDSVLYKTVFFGLLFILFMTGCKKKDAPDFHYGYYGMEPGRYVVYDVMEVIHNDQASIAHDTTRYQLKTKWGEVYIDNQGREGRVFRRYVRNSVSEQWVLQDVWSGLIDGIRAELVEENQRRIKLVFSPTISKEWDANAYNMEQEIECYYSEIHQGYTLNNLNFDSTVIVEQGDLGTAIDSLRRFEVYAKGIGLIRKYDKYLDFGFASTVVKNGYETYYTYVSSGKE